MLKTINSILEGAYDCNSRMSLLKQEVRQAVPALVEKFGPITRTPEKDGETVRENLYPTFINSEKTAFLGCHFLNVEKGEGETPVSITLSVDMTGEQVKIPYPSDVFDDDVCLLKFILLCLNDGQKAMLESMPSPYDDIQAPSE